MTPRRALPAIVALGLLAPAAAHAGRVRIGSNLKAKPTLVESAPVDSVYWNTGLASAGRVSSPVKGEVSVVRLKGRVDRSKTTQARPNVVLHVQILRPLAKGAVRPRAAAARHDRHRRGRPTVLPLTLRPSLIPCACR